MMKEKMDTKSAGVSPTTTPIALHQSPLAALLGPVESEPL